MKRLQKTNIVSENEQKITLFLKNWMNSYHCFSQINKKLTLSLKNEQQTNTVYENWKKKKTKLFLKNKTKS